MVGCGEAEAVLLTRCTLRMPDIRAREISS